MADFSELHDIFAGAPADARSRRFAGVTEQSDRYDYTLFLPSGGRVQSVVAAPKSLAPRRVRGALRIFGVVGLVVLCCGVVATSCASLEATITSGPRR